ncbi:N-(5'-phosphoribosyl)anthranilate isomerase [Paenibacillus marchantiophytorum]|uniref:N-(5'-phosphoribosyl)anthranilate isomerase n=1 Tax=Paenibacillus marchantiophytorum TaxID=1619310 RepID=A0ABQ1EVY7_9BACL|nr:phosphoribosylanthranilate isomerase [Paenibacillus marchantiophytorum]GFZ89781.1 N-(5'-phosphoribosyl)anthranilate isomerase [Paenibacillus marchantiophytorum]
MAVKTVPSVKICGLQSVEVLKSIVHLPIAHIGFVFAPSKRQVTAEKAQELISYLKSEAMNGVPIPLTVGVFVNPSEEQLTQILAVAPLDVVQLHSKETPAFCRWVREQFHVKVFKSVSISKSDNRIPLLADVSAQLDPYIGTVDAVLLDTFDPIYGGGSGTSFAWDCIPVYQEWARKAQVQLLVAGGLQPDNVNELVSAYQPDGVDVSSGVETDGVKDIAKITAFVERVNRK